MIRLLVTPESVEVAPGEPAAFTISIVSDDAFAQSASLRLVGLDPSWVGGLDGVELNVPAGGRLDVPVTVTLPPGFPDGAQLIGVEATVPGITRPALASMQLVIASTDGVSMGLSPASFRGGRRGKFRINLINRGKQPITLHLSGRPAGPVPAPDDPKAKKPELEFKFKPQEVTLRPGERARSRGVVSGKRPTVGAPRTRPMTIVAQGKTAPIHADGRFSQRPLLSRKLLRVFALFVVISMWAGALFTAVKFTQDGKTETATDASAEVDQPGGGSGPDGASGEDGGTGEAVEPGELGTDGEAPVGATISGQVEGLTDRSNVRVDLRPVTLASDLPPNGSTETTEVVDETTVASQSKSASKSKSSNKGKLQAQSVGEEPQASGPVDSDTSTVTDSEGFWAFAGLDSPANYELTFSKEGFGVRTYVVSVDEENANVPLAVTLAAGDGELSGTIDTADGPLGGATVTVTDGVVTYTTTTPTSGDVGTWSVGGLATPGTYLVTAERRGYGTETTSVSLGGSESQDGVDLTLVAGVGSISGRITSGRTGLGGILVTAASEEVTRSVTTLTDDPAGSYTLPQLPIPGSYTLTISGDGWISQTQLVELTGNDDEVDFSLLGTTASVSGVVEGPDGELEAVGVTVAQDDPLVKTLTAATPAGSYSVQGLQPGTYTVTFERFGYQTQSAVVVLAAGDRHPLNVTMEETPESEALGNATIHGIVRSGTTGDPIEDVTVQLDDASATSDANGAFVLEELPAGTYDLELSSSRYQAMTRTVRLGVLADVTIDITMLPFGGLQGQVTDLTATPLEGVEVSVVAQDGTDPVTVTPAVTDANGEYLIPQSFPTGSYTATFSMDQFGTQTRDFDVTAGSNAVADITLVELGTIAGSIQEPSSGVSGGFLPVANAHITITRTDVDPDAIVYGPTTVATGTFNVSGLQPGDYLITAYATDPLQSFTKVIDDLDLREVRDGGIVLVPGASDVNGQIFYLDASNNRVPIAAATISTRVVIGFNTLPVFPFISPILADRTGGPTAADGEYTIAGAVAGSVANYVVTAPGFVTRTVAITSSTLADEGDVVMTPLPRTVTGSATVTPAIGGGGSIPVIASIDGAALTTPPAPQTIDIFDNPASSESYSFANLQPGDYVVTFTSAGYHTETVDVNVPAGPSTTSITATAGEMIEETDIDLRIKENSLAGAVVANALVTVSVPSNPAFTPLVDTTDVNGEVQFRALDADAAGTTYRFQWSKTGYQTQTEDILLQRGDHFTGASIVQRALPQFSTLTINVISNDNCPLGTPCATGSRTALAGATVTGTPAAGGSVFSLVESSVTPGTYSITGLTPGDYVITASKALHETDTLDITAVVGSTPAQDFVLDRYSDLSITVYSDPTNTGGADSTTLDGLTETVLNGATVTATPTAGGATLTLSAQGGGVYRADDITPGSYTVAVTATNHVARTGISTSPVAGNASIGDKNVELLKYSTLTVTVTSDDDFNIGVTAGDTPINDTAVVTAVPTTAGLSTLTLTATGVGSNQYRVSNVPPSDYTISASFTNHETATTSVTQAAAVAQTASLILLKYPPAYVLVTDADDVPLDGATVTATTAAGSTVAFTPSGTPGVYTTPALAPGTNTINASKAGFGQGSSSLVITAGTIPTLDEPTGGPFVANTVVVLEEDATIVVNVYDTTLSIGSTELNDVEVSLRVLADSTFPTRHRYTGELAGAGDDGKVTFSNLSATPDYQIRVSKAGYDLVVQDVVLDPGDVDTVNVVLTRLSSLIVTVRSDDDATADVSAPTLAGATVVATPDAGGAGTVLSPTGVTGVYIAPYLPYGGAYTVSVSAAGHASNTAAITVTVGVNQSTTVLLNRYPTVAVQVNEDDGSPAAITNATVTLTPTSGSPLTVGHSAAGLYQRALVDPGSYTLTVSKTGWATSTQTVNATAGAAFSTVTVGLAPLRDVTLVLFSETIDTGTSELDGVTADLYDAFGGLVRSETSDDDGEVVFEDLAPGSTYRVEASKDRWIPGSLSFTVPNADGSFQQLALTSYPDIVAVVRSDDGTPAALTGATVVATPSGGGASVPLAPTGTAGQYRAVNVLPGTYTLTASAPSHTSVTTASLTTTLGSDDTTFSVTPIDLPAFPTLSVTVLSNNLTAGAGDDTGLTTATVTATPSSGGAPITLAHAGAGVYTSTLVPPSTTYAISVTDAGHVTNTGSVAGTVGATHTTSITLLQLPTVDVQVNDDDGGTADPITDATVTITPTAGGAALTLTHTATGLYRRASVPGTQTYTLSVSKTGFVTSTQTVTVTNGVTFAPVTVALKIQRSITVEVRSDTLGGALVSGATVELLDSNGVAVESHTTPGSGQVTFAGLTPGTAYTFRISSDGFVTEEITETPVVGSNTTRQEAIASYPDLTVTVRSDDGTPAALATATVVAIPAGGGPGVQVLPTATAGEYKALNIAAGDDYTINVTAPGHVSATITDVDIVLGTDETVGPVDLDAYATLQVTVLSNDLTIGDASDDDALATATVTATPSDGGAVVSLGYTGAGGIYRAVGVAPSTTYTITIVESGHVSTATSLLGAAGAAPYTTTSTMLELPSVSVLVNEDDGSPAAVTDATVTLTPTAGGAALAVAHGAGATYSRASVPAGSYTLSVAKTGWATSSQTVTVTAGVAFSDVSVGLQPLRDIELVLFSDVIDTGTSELPDVLAVLTDTDGNPLATETSDTDGSVVFEDLAPGTTYGVALSRVGWDSLETTFLMPNLDGTFQQLVLTSQYPTLRVTVLSNDLTAGAGDDDPLATATVTATPSDGGPVVSLAYTGAGGIYEAIGALPSTTYSVAVSDAAHASGSGTIAGTLTAGVHSTSVTLDELPPIAVHVNKDDGAVTNAAGATVTLTPVGGGTPLALTDDGAGDYSRASIPAGSYTLSASLSGFVTETRTSPVVVTAGTDIPGSPFTLVLEEAGSIEVTAFDDDGVTELAGADVDLTVPADSSIAVRRVTTGADGIALFADLQPGLTYRIVISKAGFTSVDDSIALDAGDTFQDDYTLLHVATLTVTVDSLPGTVDVDGAIVIATPDAGGTPLAIPQTSAGTYVLSGIDPGLYDVSATASGYSSAGADATESVDISVGEDASADLVLDKYPTLSVTVQSSVTVGAEVLTALTNATVVADDGGGGHTVTLTHQGNGLYSAPITVAGTYDLTIDAPGHTSRTVNSNAVLALGGADQSAGTEKLVAVSGDVAGTVTVFGGADNAGVVVTATRNGVTVTGLPNPTAAAGVYAFSTAGGNPLAPGVWQLTFTKDTYGPLTMSLTVPYGTGSAPGTGANLTGINATIAPLGTSIIGSTRGIASSEPISAGNPVTALSGVVVTITAGPDTRPAQTVFSDGDGNFVFSFNDLAPGAYTFQYSLAGGVYTTESHSVTVVAGQIVVEAPVLVAVARTVTVNAADGATDVDGVVFRFTNDDLLAAGFVDVGPTVSGTADSVTALPPGDYEVTVQTPAAGYAEHSPGADSFTVPYVGSAAVYDEEFDGSGSASGTVVLNDDAATATVGNDGNAVGATVTITDGSFSGEATVASDGTWSILNIPQANDYDVIYELDGYATITQTDFLDVDATAEVLGQKTLDKLSSLTVTVVDDTGSALSATTLGLFTTAAGTVRTTDYDGTASANGNGTTYTFEGLTPGTTVFAIGTKTGNLQVVNATTTLQAGANAGSEGVTVTLPRTGTVTLSVIGLDATETVQVTFDWTRLTVAEQHVATLLTFASPGANAETGFPANTSITASLTTTQTCTIDGTSNIAAATFTLTPNQTRTLIYDCTD